MTKEQSEVLGRKMSRGEREIGTSGGGGEESIKKRLGLKCSRWKQLMKNDRYR